MEITSHIQLTGIRNSEEKRIEIGNQVYLISKHGISIRKEVIFEKEFSRVPMDKTTGIAQHLKFDGSFNIDGKLLNISAESKTTFGPLGDRLLLYANYDHKAIGNYSALRSYMGGGSTGKWPFIKTKECSIVFKFNSTGFHNENNLFKIEYFKTIIHDPYVINEAEARKCTNGKTLSEEFLNDSYEIQDLEKHKVMQWLVPIKNETGEKQIGNIACYTYPEFEMYRKIFYGDFINIAKMKENRTFIGKARDLGSLHTLDIELNDKREILFPWQQTEISFKI